MALRPVLEDASEDMVATAVGLLSLAPSAMIVSITIQCDASCCFVERPQELTTTTGRLLKRAGLIISPPLGKDSGPQFC